jgi:SAM-dependent methyltransferase
MARMSAFARGLGPLVPGPTSNRLPEDRAVMSYLSDRDRSLRYREPRYQLQLMKDLAALLPAGDCRVLDVGAGSGLIGEALAALLPGKSVIGIDVAPRPLPQLGIPLLKFDGRRIPFADGAFDCVLFCNVLHHVRRASRVALLREALRVSAGGPIVVKDHLPSAPLDGWRLWLLDVLGNAPRGAMVSADYLGATQWAELLEGLGCAAQALPVSAYRRGVWRWCFPNRLETCFRLSRAATPAR